MMTHRKSSFTVNNNQRARGVIRNTKNEGRKGGARPFARAAAADSQMSGTAVFVKEIRRCHGTTQAN